MPRYHFHLREGDGLLEDVEGQEFGDADAARSEALRNVRALLAADVLEGRLDLRGRLEVVEEGGGPLFTIAFRDAVVVRM